MKLELYSILYSAWQTLNLPNATRSNMDIAADLIATVLTIDPADDVAAPVSPWPTSAPIPPAAAEPVSREALRNVAPADPRPETPAMEPPAAPSGHEKLITQIQAIIDEAHSDDATVVLDRIKSAGIRLVMVAELLGVKNMAIYNCARGSNKSLEEKFWKIFSKPNLSSRNRLTEEA